MFFRNPLISKINGPLILVIRNASKCFKRATDSLINSVNLWPILFIVNFSSSLELRKAVA
jgi:hypothetical protein